MIANASTEVPVSKSIGEVFEVLAKMGASSISIRYDDQATPSGVGFELTGPGGSRSFELPLQIEGVRMAMVREGAKGKKAERAQAARVAWRITKDWLRAQGALIEAQMAHVEEVMLPYLVLDTDEHGAPVTLYGRYVASGRALAIEGPR